MTNSNSRIKKEKSQKTVITAANDSRKHRSTNIVCGKQQTRHQIFILRPPFFVPLLPHWRKRFWLEKGTAQLTSNPRKKVLLLIVCFSFPLLHLLFRIFCTWMVIVWWKRTHFCWSWDPEIFKLWNFLFMQTIEVVFCCEHIVRLYLVD